MREYVFRRKPQAPAAYLVKLEPGHIARDYENIDGYLASGGRIVAYSRGEAIKKGQHYGGKATRLSTFTS